MTDLKIQNPCSSEVSKKCVWKKYLHGSCCVLSFLPVEQFVMNRTDFNCRPIKVNGRSWCSYYLFNVESVTKSKGH